MCLENNICFIIFIWIEKEQRSDAYLLPQYFSENLKYNLQKRNFCIVMLYDSQGVSHSFTFYLRKMFKVSNRILVGWLVEIHTIIAMKTNNTIISCGACMFGMHPQHFPHIIFWSITTKSRNVIHFSRSILTSLTSEWS